MVKSIELIVVAILLLFSFFAGVNYSETVKEHSGWLFEVREEEEEVVVPELSREGIVNINPDSAKNNSQ